MLLSPTSLQPGQAMYAKHFKKEKKKKWVRMKKNEQREKLKQEKQTTSMQNFF